MHPITTFVRHICAIMLTTDDRYCRSGVALLLLRSVDPELGVAAAVAQLCSIMLASVSGP